MVEKSSQPFDPGRVGELGRDELADQVERDRSGGGGRPEGSQAARIASTRGARGRSRLTRKSSCDRPSRYAGWRRGRAVYRETRSSGKS